MNRQLSILLGLACLAASACVRSLDPFCPAAAREPRADLNGAWVETDEAGQPRPARRWVIADNEVTTTNAEEHTGGALTVAFFQAGEVWFADTAPRAFKSGADGWWLTHHAPLHHLCRVALDGDRLKLTPLDQDWLRRALSAGNDGPAGIRQIHAAQNLFAGRPAAWHELLAAVGSDPNAFPDARTIVLRRAPAP